MTDWDKPLEGEDSGVVRVIGRDVPYPDLRPQRAEPIPAPMPKSEPERQPQPPSVPTQGLSDPDLTRRRHLDQAVAIAERIVGDIGLSLDHLDVYNSNAPGGGLDIKLLDAAVAYLGELREYQDRVERLKG